MVRLPATNPAQKLPAEGKGSPLPFWGPSQSFGFSLFPLGVRRPEVTKYQHLLIPLCDLHSSLTVTFLTGRHCLFQREDSINLNSIVSVGYHVTPPSLREERDNRNTIEKKKSNSFHCSLSFSFSSLFFFSLYFSCIPFLLHALTNSFLFLFSSFLIFTIEEDNSFSLSFSLSSFLFL